MAFDIRKTQVAVEETWHERGPRLTAPLRVGMACAVIRNPFAGRYEKDLLPFMAELRELGTLLSKALIERLGENKVEAYGKGAIVGEDRGHARHATHDSARPYPGRLCAQPFRHRRNDRVGRPAPRRDRLRPGDG